MNYDVAKIRKELTNLVDKLKEQSDNVSNMEHVPSLEINVMMARVNRLYEKAVLYKHILIAEESMQEQVPAETSSTKIVEDVTISEDKTEDVKLPVLNEINTDNTVTQNANSGNANSEKRKVSISEGAPITNLKKSLGINERYLYSNELFKGKMENLLTAIDEIEKQSTLENALGLINTKWAIPENWNEDDTHVINFKKLVERRFL